MDVARGAPNLASTLNQGAFNIGCAFGASFGSVRFASARHTDALPWVGVALGAFGLALAVLSLSLDRRSVRLAPAACG
jgi:DHA1 family inner membrane transport protein